MLRAGVGWPVRREILKLIGVLGAIDPTKFKEILFSAGIEMRGDEELTRSNENQLEPTNHTNQQSNNNAANAQANAQHRCRRAASSVTAFDGSPQSST